ncbi:hypothetical protein PN471_08025, partial [Aphanizomenon sp. CS-733/32]|uniref:hypothetical protein n=1 Tax=Aphanizomenon sp. CS-733/32 TaxID=3021715 RepID=UPI00232ECA6A
NAFGKLFDMIVVTFFASGASLSLFFYSLIFSNYCHISSSTALSPVKDSDITPQTNYFKINLPA